MTTETMTIHEALSELKMLDKRIRGKISTTSFAVTHKAAVKKIDGKTIEEISANIKSDYNSICDLLKRRVAIKNAVVLSNAGAGDNVTRDINIDGKDYTLAEIIDMKNCVLPLVETLLNFMTKCKNSKNADLLYNKENLQKDADEYAVRYASNYVSKNDKSTDDATLQRCKESFKADHTVEVIDPLKIDSKVETISKWIGEFTSKVDGKVSVHNATTTISVEY